MNLRLGDLGCAALEEQAQLHRNSLDEVVRIAALHHLSELDNGRMALRVPRFGHAHAADPPLEIELDLDDSAWSSLRHVAAMQGTRIERLIEHVVWCYLADLDSGVVTTRILDPRTAGRPARVAGVPPQAVTGAVPSSTSAARRAPRPL